MKKTPWIAWRQGERVNVQLPALPLTQVEDAWMTGSAMHLLHDTHIDGVRPQRWQCPTR